MYPLQNYATHYVFSVQELNQQVDQVLRAEMGSVWVEGEVSNLRRYASGHQYFSLKDAQATVSCTLFRQHVQQAQPFSDGDQVRLLGRVGLYTARGQFQIIVERLESAGEGRLLLAFQRLKQKLLVEGLFDPQRKQSVPVYIRRLGVVTSAQGDVRHDIARTLARRFPLLLPFKLYPVAVQGPQAVPQIMAALSQASAEAEVDVLIMARGGGSLEDLWAFNDEGLARAIAACPIPVVTGIGHETDTTIADFVADVRASTPTAAAETVSPDSAEVRRRLRHWQQHLVQQVRGHLTQIQSGLTERERRLQRLHPGRRIEQQRLQLDDDQRRLQQLIGRRLQALQHILLQQQRLLQRYHPAPVVVQQGLRLQQQRSRLARQVEVQVRTQAQRLQSLRHRLQALSPEAVLQRGYSLLQTQDGTIVRHAEAVTEGTVLQARLSRGSLQVQVIPKSG